jgi:hypothetical protein
VRGDQFGYSHALLSGFVRDISAVGAVAFVAVALGHVGVMPPRCAAAVLMMQRPTAARHIGLDGRLQMRAGFHRE